MKQKNILVVDDCEDVRFLLNLKLSNMGHEVYQASDGQDALEIIKEDPEIDIVLLDIIMPKKNGIEVIEKIKEYNKNITIICISAHFDVESSDTLIELGANEVIQKPIKGDTLNKRLSKYLGRSTGS